MDEEVELAYNEGENEDVEATQADDVREMTASEKYNFRTEGRRILQALDESQRQDLSLHLYSTHLMHRDLKVTRHMFPKMRWAEWPMTSIAKNEGNGDVFDHCTPIPDVNDRYTDPVHPARKPASAPLSLRDRFRSPTMHEATDILFHELDAVYQRAVNQQLYKRGLEPRVEPPPKLPVQTCTKVFERLEGLLDRVVKERVNAKGKVGTTYKPEDWMNVLSHDLMAGNPLDRCRRLFLRKKKQVPLRRYHQLSMMQGHVHRAPIEAKPAKAIAKERQMTSKLPKVTNSELLMSMSAKLPEIPPEFSTTKKHVKKTMKTVQKLEKLTKTLQHSNSLDIVDPKTYKIAKSMGAFNVQTPDDLFVTNIKGINLKPMPPRNDDDENEENNEEYSTELPDASGNAADQIAIEGLLSLRDYSFTNT
ncbi:hypothetical protein TRICI_001768 [Trichomonascus ciferrii]|uniref:Rrn9 domain-containing protein n=1 Tax=Trichomonascus ciferrii TaxID=44093 RepID=A0A642V961_9ASCO|nr:hypothetical protein TRICI_001768 [Trichomonascus ciferrii]